jgi:undecaprenyl-diphosphatase
MPPILFDKEVLQCFSSYELTHKRFNDFVILLSDNDLLKGGIIVAVCWCIGFAKSENLLRNRKGIFTTVLFSFVALFFTRIIVHVATFRPRPFLNKSLTLATPENLNILAFSRESSFPSDHATLFMALSYGIWKINKKVGIGAIFYTILFILIPRMYLGLHYPTDIVLGSLIGIVMVEMGFRFHLSEKLDPYLFQFADKKPALFFPLLFLISYQIADLFEDTRTLMGFILHGK